MGINRIYNESQFSEYVNNIINSNIDNNQSFITNTISDISGKIIRNTSLLSRFKELGLLDGIQSFNTITYRISRFIFCPNDRISNEIHHLLNIMDNTTLVGIQIRTGGTRANTKERVSFHGMDDLPRIRSTIQHLIQPHISIYVSTDSNYILDYLNNNTNNQVYYMTVFGRGHSAPAHNKKTTLSSLEGAICDLGVLSFSNMIYFTKGSSYGRLASVLSNGKSNYI